MQIFKSKFHFHKDEHDILHKCYHTYKSMFTSRSFWLAITVSYPLEHYLWENVPPFSTIAHYLGLLH